MKKDFLRLSLTLCAITLTAALILAFVNSVTKDKIANADKIATENAMKNIVADADAFEQLNENVTVCKKGNDVIGYCATVYPKGFGGEIKMIVGINTDNKVLGIDVISHSETAGLGAKSDTPEFEERFKGKDSNISIVKTPTESDSEVLAITGATITSKAVAQGVKDASELVEKAKGGEQ